MRSLWPRRYSFWRNRHRYGPSCADRGREAETAAVRARTRVARRVALGGLLQLLVVALWPSTVRSDADVVPVFSEVQRNPIAQLVESIDHCTASLSELERWRLAGIVHDESQRQGYDPLFVLAMIQIESGCSRTARGPGGGVGLVQIQPATARAVAREASLPWRGEGDLTRPAVNVQLALEYLSQLEDRFGDPLVAMAAYNMGPGRVARMPRHRAQRARYVRKILARYEFLLIRSRVDRV